MGRYLTRDCRRLHQDFRFVTLNGQAVRLAKRVAELVPCSRRQAEQYIEGGWVRVDGEVVETPQFKVLDQRVQLDPDAKLEPAVPATLLLHKPVGFATDAAGKSVFQLLLAQNRTDKDRSGIRLLKRHLLGQVCVTPLETAASGLVVFSQEFSVQRKLQQEAAWVEHEVTVEVTDEVSAAVLQQLTRAPVIDGRAMLPAKVSLSSQTGKLTGLRFAVKGLMPGQLAQMCDAVGLRISAMKRIRIGRVPLAGLIQGQWRYLMPHERF